MCMKPDLNNVSLSLTQQCLRVQWAEVISADAFSAFEEAGLDNDQVTCVVAKYVICLIYGNILYLSSEIDLYMLHEHIFACMQNLS